MASGIKWAGLRRLALSAGVALALAVVVWAPGIPAFTARSACERQAVTLMYQLVRGVEPAGPFDAAVDAMASTCPRPQAPMDPAQPALANLYFQHANHAWNQGQWQAAGDAYRTAIDYAPGQAPAYRRLAEVLLYRLGDPAAALAQLDMAQGIEPREGYGYIIGAHAYAALGEHERALGEAQHAVSLAPTAYAYQVQGEMLADLGRWPAAVESYRQSLALDGRAATTYLLLGNALLASGSPADARQAWAEAQRLDPALHIPTP